MVEVEVVAEKWSYTGFTVILFNAFHDIYNK